MNAQQLVTEAIYESLQDREFQPQINAGYEKTALNFLNRILDGWRDYIPFSEEVTFDNVENLKKSTFVSIDTVNYVLNNVSFSLMALTLDQYKDVQRITNLKGFPEYYFFDLLTQTVRIYPEPSDISYKFTIWGKIQQITLGLFDEIPANMPPFMQDAIIYQLAYRLCASYGVAWDDDKEKIRKDLIATLYAKNDFDFRGGQDIAFPGNSGTRVPPFPYFYMLSGGGK